MRLDDGLQSFALKLGQKQADLQYVRGTLLTDRKSELDALWVGNWIANKICVKRPNDMVRRWREISSNNLTAEQIEQFDKLERRFKLREILSQALSWSSLYGSVVLFIKTNSAALDMPLQPSEQLERLVILPKEKVSPFGVRNDDLLSPNYGLYDNYSISGQVEIHHSRLIIINARECPLSDNEIWGISDLEPVIETLKRFDGASANIGDLIYESKIDIFKIAGLSDKLSAGREDEVANAISAVQAIKSATNSLLLDPENEYEQKELTFGGLRDLLVEFRNAVAGAADMPVTILFGQSASGFASGEEDITNYHESVHNLQEKRLRPVFERLDPMLCQLAFGSMPEDWWFEFVPLRELTQEQQMNMLTTFATATNTLMQNGVLREDQVANELKESGLFANISAEDVELLNVDESVGNFEEPKDEEQETDEVQADQDE